MELSNPTGNSSAELAIVATLVFESANTLPPHLALLVEHAPATFSDNLAGDVACAVRLLRANDTPVESYSVANALPLFGDATAGDVAQLAPQAIGVDLAELEAGKLWRAYAARRLKTELLTAADALEKTGNAALVTKGIKAALDVASAATDSLAHQLPSRLFRVTDPPPEAPAIFAVQGIPIGTPGNLSAITAPVKSGKTAWMNAMIAAALRPGCREIDTFAITAAPNPEGKALVHLDTEQSPFDHWQSIARTLHRAQIDAPPAWLRSYWLAGLNGPKARAALRTIIRMSVDQFWGLYAVLIDGVADLASDVNDPDECNDLVAELSAIAIEHHCHVANAIHLNPQSETKSRGHLGSQLERKAETNLLLKKDGEITGVSSAKQRRAPITEGTGPHFTWSHDDGMHMSCPSPAFTAAREKEQAERAEGLSAAEDVFRTRPGMPFGELKTTIKDTLKVSPATAERRVKQWLALNIITKHPGGIYAPSTSVVTITPSNHHQTHFDGSDQL